MIIPILLKPCDWSMLPISQIQYLPKNGKPISSWTDQDLAFLEVTQEIGHLVKCM